MVVTAFVVQSTVPNFKRSAFCFVIDKEQRRIGSKESYLALVQQRPKRQFLLDIEKRVDAL